MPEHRAAPACGGAARRTNNNERPRNELWVSWGDAGRPAGWVCPSLRWGNGVRRPHIGTMDHLGSAHSAATTGPPAPSQAPIGATSVAPAGPGQVLAGGDRA